MATSKKKTTSKKAPAKKAPVKKTAAKKPAAKKPAAKKKVSDGAQDSVKKIEPVAADFFKRTDQELASLIDSVPAQVTVDTTKAKSWLRRFFKGL